MLRTFIRTTRTPERADLIIRAIDLIEQNNYLSFIDQLEATAADDTVPDNQAIMSALEAQLGDVITALFAAHSVHIEYDQNRLDEIVGLLEFLLHFGTEKGYMPENLQSENDIWELGDTNEEILINLFDGSGHNPNGNPLDFVTWVGVTFVHNLKNFITTAVTSVVEEEHDEILQGDDLENLRKFAALFPDSLAVKHIKEVRGVYCNINNLFFRYDDDLSKMSAPNLAIEIVGFVLISKTPEDQTKADFALSIIEGVAGQSTRALDVVNVVKQTIDKVGLK